MTLLCSTALRCAAFIAGFGVALVAGPATLCESVSQPHPWQVRITPDDAGIQITKANGGSQHLRLRERLLPQVHYLADSRHALMATRDGWILRLDLEHAELLSETRTSVLINSTALSIPRVGQPQLLAVANAEPRTLTIFDEQLQLIKQIRAIDKFGRSTLGILAIRTAVERDSFVALLDGAPELWEVSYNPRAPEISLGWVHDFQYREGQFVPGYLNPLRSTLPSAARDFYLIGLGHEALTIHATATAPNPSTDIRLQVTHLDVRRTGAEYVVKFLPIATESPLIFIDTKSVPNGYPVPIGVDRSTLKFSALPTAPHSAACAVRQ